jgi:hypothetical protein
MPEIDSASPFWRLFQLAREYIQLINYTMEYTLSTEELEQLNSERSGLHDSIWRECIRIGLTEDRETAAQRALTLAKWFSDANDWPDYGGL